MGEFDKTADSLPSSKNIDERFQLELNLTARKRTAIHEGNQPTADYEIQKSYVLY